VIVMAGNQSRQLVVTPLPGKPIGLPASFSVELSPSLTGPVAIFVDARDASGLAIAHGTATQQNIDVGGQTVITVTLVSGALPGVDAGDADGGGADAGGGAASTGGAGGGGTGGGGGGMGGGGRGGGGAGVGGGGLGGKAQDAGGDVAMDLGGAFNAAATT